MLAFVAVAAFRGSSLPRQTKHAIKWFNQRQRGSFCLVLAVSCLVTATDAAAASVILAATAAATALVVNRRELAEALHLTNGVGMAVGLVQHDAPISEELCTHKPR